MPKNGIVWWQESYSVFSIRLIIVNCIRYAIKKCVLIIICNLTIILLMTDIRLYGYEVIHITKMWMHKMRESKHVSNNCPDWLYNKVMPVYT